MALDQSTAGTAPPSGGGDGAPGRTGTDTTARPGPGDGAATGRATSSGPDGATPGSGPGGDGEASVADLFRWIYRFFYSKTVGLAIILAMAVLVLLGVLIGQAPAGTYDDPAARAQFLEQATGKYGGWTSLLDVLGLFRVFSSPIFLVVIGLLALSIVACTVHRVPQLWQRYRHPRVHVSARFFDRARYRGTVQTSLDPDRALALARDRLRARHWRVVPDGDAPGAAYADRFAWGGFGTVVAHASFIVILVAFAVSGAGGIDDTLTVPVGGDAVEVGHGTGLSVRATSFDATYDENGRPLDYVSHLVVSDAGGLVGEQDVRVNEPLGARGVRFHQASFGLAADVVARQAGQVLYSGSVPLSWTSEDGATQIGRFDLPGAGTTVYVITPASGRTDSGLAPGEAAFKVYPTGSSEALGTVTAEPGTPVSVGDLELTFSREREYTGIMVRQDPGALWMWIGSALLVLGMTVTFTCRHRRVWIRTEQGQVRFASADPEDLAFERQFRGLVLGVASALDADSASDRGAESSPRPDAGSSPLPGAVGAPEHDVGSSSAPAAADAASTPDAAGVTASSAASSTCDNPTPEGGNRG